MQASHSSPYSVLGQYLLTHPSDGLATKRVHGVGLNGHTRPSGGRATPATPACLRTRAPRGSHSAPVRTESLRASMQTAAAGARSPRTPNAIGRAHARIGGDTHG